MFTQVKTKTRQKVVLAIGVVALLAGLGGFMSALGHARGFGFGWPIKRVPLLLQKKTMLPAYDESRLCTIRSSTGGTIKVPCSSIKKTE